MFKIYFLFFLILTQLSCSRPTGSSRFGSSSRGNRTPIIDTQLFVGKIFNSQFASNFQRQTDDYMSAAINPTKSNLGLVSGFRGDTQTGVYFFGQINLNSNLRLTSGSLAVAVLDDLRNQKGGSFRSTFHSFPKAGDHITQNNQNLCVDTFRISFKDNYGTITLAGAVSNRGVQGRVEYQNNTCYCNSHSCSYCRTINTNYNSSKQWGDFSIPYKDLFNQFNQACVI